MAAFLLASVPVGSIAASGDTYVPLTPARILDTRSGTGGVDHPLTSHVPITFQATGVGGVPAGAAAVTGNLTVVGQSSQGWLYIGPGPLANPGSSTLNFRVGDILANGVTVTLSSTGSLSITFVGTGLGPEVIFDVSGYFVADSSGDTYVPLTPARILDTRSGTGGVDHPLTSHVPITFQATGVGGVPAGAAAVTGNLTVVGQSSQGWLYIGPGPLANPGSSTLNFRVGDILANGVTVTLSSTGSLSITFVGTGLGPEVIFDVSGYFVADSSGDTYVPLTPARILDTRSGTGGVDHPLTSHVPITFQATGVGGVPAGAAAVTGNLTVVGQSSQGWLYIGPGPLANPGSSTLNFRVGDILANGVTVTLSSTGSLSVTFGAPGGSTTAAVFDVGGYFIGSGAPVIGPPVTVPPVAGPPASSVSIVAAGDIACDPAHNVGQPIDCEQAATADLIGQLNPTAVLTLGDNQYQVNALSAYQSVFAPTWGHYKSIIYPTIGNHEYLTPGAAGYFAYFGFPPYYSYDLGAWHIISLDSSCHYVGGCQAGSPQERWLLADLAAHPNVCTLVTYHEPSWSSGQHGDASQMTTIWADLVAAHVDVVLSGHNHDYERFVPLDAAGSPDPAGPMEFVVGTGGKSDYAFTNPPLTGEVVRADKTFGLLDMTLGPSSFSWSFVPVAGGTFTDSGSASCH